MTAMRMVDVFKVLLGGGWICEITPSVGKRVRYTVVSPWRKSPPPGGHITQMMFYELVESGVIISAYDETEDKYGNIHSRYVLPRTVVYCRDCTWWVRTEGVCSHSPTGACFYWSENTRACDYCSYGEHRWDITENPR